MRLPFETIVLDVETNGSQEHRIVELGAVRLDRDLREADSWSSLIDGRPMVLEAIQVNNITDEMLKGKPAFAEVHGQFDDWCAKSDLYVLSAFGAYFDMPVLRAEYSRLGRKFPHPGHALDVKSILWWEFLKRGLPCKRLTVDHALELLGMPFEGTRHRALDDARNEARMLQKIHGRTPP